MSWQVVSWANNQPTDSPSAHLVLVQLANIAGQDGVVRLLDIEYLSRVSKQSRRSVFRRLGEFERAGVLSREVVSRGEDGRAVMGARLHVDREWQAMQEAHDTSADAEDENGDFDGSEEGGSANLALPEVGGAVPPSASGSATAGTPSLYVLKTKLNNIPPTPHEVDATDEGAIEEGKLDAWLAQFQRSYPFDATMSVTEARKAGAALSLKDRARALRWAIEYAADLKGRGGSRPVDAARWLRQRRFDEVEQIKGGRAKAAGLANPHVFVAVGTRAFEAWVSAGHKRGLSSARGPAGKTGWYFPSCFPPGVDPPADSVERV